MKLSHPKPSTYKIISLWLLLLSVLFSLCACADASDIAPQSDAPNSVSLLSHWACHTGVMTHTPTLPAPIQGVSARSAVLVRADTGEVLFEQNAKVKLPMASTTKIMTALVAVDTLPLDTLVTIPAQAVGVEGSSIYLIEGEVLSLESLLYGLLLSSANDAAVAIALTCAPSVEDCAALMNQKAQDLGLKDTHFVNPHGLDDPDHYTTALDLAQLASVAVMHPVLCGIMSTQKTTIPLHGEEGVRWLVNHNKLLSSYDGAVGVKTGYTKKSGRCLVSAAQRDELTLVAVTLNAPDDWRDHTAMLDYGFSLYDTIELCQAGAYAQPLSVVGGTQDYVMVKNTQGLTLPIHKGYGDIVCQVEIPRFVYAKVTQGQLMGYMVYTTTLPDGTQVTLGRVPLYAGYSVEPISYKQNLGQWLKSLFT